MDKIRNFGIIAHIDHGKSTMADRMLEITGTIEKRKMRDQILDQMDLERERGITIKLQPVRMEYQGYILNLIDTPGHVDFTYEVSRSLAAVEGAVLLVDSTQGIQAQTLANLYLALEQDLAIIPVINKIDLPAANIEKTKKEIIQLLGCEDKDIILASGKTGQGVAEVLKAVIERVPAPHTSPYPSPSKGEGTNAKVPLPASPAGGLTKDILPLPEGEIKRGWEGEVALRALIFDSTYDEYRGVVAYVRIFDGGVKKGDKITLLATKAKSEALDVGIFKPEYRSTGELKTGEIGYIVTGFKDLSECRVGDTVALTKFAEATKSLKGYNEVKPMVFAGIFPREGNEFAELREAVARLKLNDASLVYEPEHSEALGVGFRCGFLGLLHLEIFQERLKREYNLNLIVTIPSVAYKVHLKDEKNLKIKKTGSGNDEDSNSFIMRSPQKLPDPSQTEKIEEPWVSLDIIAPKEYIGSILNLVQEKKGIYKNTEYIDESRVILHYEIPLAAILTDFYDKIKSASSGYASLNYEFLGYRPADVVKMDIIVAEDIVEALSMIVYREQAFRRGKEVVETLKETLPKQMFVVKLQAAIGGKIIAAERISAMKKDVIAKLYGGDVSRKRKLLEKQKKGKKKMEARGKGSVEIPSDVFVKLLKR